MRDPAARLTPVAPDSRQGRFVLRAYMQDVASRYWGRPATAAEVERALLQDPSDDLVPPGGILVCAEIGERLVACGGLRGIGCEVSQLTRIWVAADTRRRGLGASIVGYLERYAVRNGSRTVRLDTRSDLTEARSLYTGLGYREVPAFNDDPYAEHWFEKPLC
jgi:ribosomal protein S18 acetylase RimI-like enzyme